MNEADVPGDFVSFVLASVTVISRSGLIYGFGLTALRVGKSRTLSQATPVDALLVLILGSVLGRGIVGSTPLFTVFWSSATLVGLHWVLSRLACRSHQLGILSEVHTRKLVSDGIIDWQSMNQSHLSEHDLLEELRLNGNVEDLKQVASAYKERSGAIGVIKSPKSRRF